MKRLHLVQSADGPALIESEAEIPKPGSGELLIQVHAAGITPTELNWYPTLFTQSGAPRLLAVPGHEFSGVVASAGPGVGDLAVGHEVFGMNGWFEDGALSEYCIAPWSSLVPKPAEISHAEAAAVPIAALTAWQGLFDRTKLQPGETVLIHGGAGSVGSFAVQLAAWHGAKVIATASARNLDFVTGLGASQVLDYRGNTFDKELRDVDVVFDTVGGETLAHSERVLKPGGRMVTISATEEGKNWFLLVEPNQHQLVEILKLLADGVIRSVVDSVVPLSQAPEVFNGRFPRRGFGKVVAAMAD